MQDSHIEKGRYLSSAIFRFEDSYGFVEQEKNISLTVKTLYVMWINHSVKS